MIPLKDTNPTGKFPFWVVVIIAINIYFFFQELTASDPDGFILKYALVPQQVTLSDPNTWWPFITSQFLHGGFIHIISNMLFLWIFGDNVAERLGFLIFPIFYLAAGVAGGLLQYIVDPASSIPMLGASGAIAGVLGAYYVLFPRHKIDTLVPVFGFVTVMAIPAQFMLFYWFITQLFSSAAAITSHTQSLGGVAYLAHIGGFIFGIIVGDLSKGSATTLEPLEA